MSKLTRAINTVFLSFVMLLVVTPMIALADIESIDSTVNPGTISVGEQATLAFSLVGETCTTTTTAIGTDGADVVFVIDRSGSMRDENRMEAAIEAAIGFVDRMNLPADRGAVVSFSSDSRLDAGLGSSESELLAVLDSLRPGGGTAIGRGIATATQELLDNPSDNSSAMIVLSDGEETAGSDPEGQAAIACDAGIQLFTIGLGGDIDPVLQRIPCNGGFYREAPTPAELDEIYQRVADVILDVSVGPAGTDATITDTVPPGLSVLSDSVSNGGLHTGGSITWQLRRVDDGTMLSYAVVGDEPGTYTIGPAEMTYTDCAGDVQTLSIADRTLIVEAPPPLVLPETGASRTEVYMGNLMLLLLLALCTAALGLIYVYRRSPS
jgi:hypothetical protein